MTESDNNIKKKALIEAYIKSFGNVTQACNAVGLSRETFYRWQREDKSFKNAIEKAEPEERFMDFLESKLVEKINGGDTTSIIFALKTKGKKRGYIERQEIEHSSDVETNVVFEIHKRNKDT